jgi:hypothetical protein
MVSVSLLGARSTRLLLRAGDTADYPGSGPCDELPITITTPWSKAGITEAGRHGDQLVRDDRLAPHELPGRPLAAQLPRCLPTKFWLQLVKCGFHLDARHRPAASVDRESMSRTTGAHSPLLRSSAVTIRPCSSNSHAVAGEPHAGGHAGRRQAARHRRRRENHPDLLTADHPVQDEAAKRTRQSLRHVRRGPIREKGNPPA